MEGNTVKDYPEFAPDAPSDVAIFGFSLSAPEYGWMDMQLRSAGIEYRLSLSFVFDPFDDIRLFLECVAQGSGAQLLINDEGHFHFFRAGEADANGQFRLALWNTLALQSRDGRTYDLTLVWDVMVERHDFVRSFYQAILEVWAQPDDFAFRRAWFNFTEDADPYEDDEGLARALPKVRSPELDRFLELPPDLLAHDSRNPATP